MSACLTLERVSSFISQNPRCEISDTPFQALLQNHITKTAAPYSGCVAIRSRKDEPRFFDSELLLCYLRQEQCFSYPKDDNRPFREVFFFSTRNVRHILPIKVERTEISESTQHVVMAHSAIKMDEVRKARHVIYSANMIGAGQEHSQGNLNQELFLHKVAVSWLQSIVKDYPEDTEAAMLLADHKTHGIGCPKDEREVSSIIEQSAKIELKKLSIPCLKFSLATTCCFFLPSQTVQVALLGLFALKLLPKTKNLCHGQLAHHFKIGSIASIVLRALYRPFFLNLASLPSLTAKIFACIQPTDLLYLGLSTYLTLSKPLSA